MNVAFFPKEASNFAPQVDHLFFFLTGVALFFTVLIFLTVAIFAVKYRRRSPDQVGADIHGSNALEVTWTLIPLGLTMVMFFWGAKIFYSIYTPPRSAMTVYVVGKQWMWKIQHPEGKSEIDELHVPLNQPVRLVLTSEDVIHDFFIPDFRVKMDVVPGRYTSYWFTPTKLGRYRFFCAQYCGTQHANMVGWVDVMEPAEYQAWASRTWAGETMAEQGQKLFARYNCASCHREGGKGPVLAGLYGKPVIVEGEKTRVADDAYIRESILTPNSHVVAGFPAIMPSYQGQLSEEEILQLIAYIRSLGTEDHKGAIQ